MDAYQIIRIDESTWAIDEGMVRSYLLAGTEKALLIDTGNGAGDLRALVESLTDRPVLLVNTHADGDHTGCNGQFGAPCLHPSEFASYEERNPGKPHLPLREGAVLDLGGRSAEVLLVPGHTCGSIALLERERRRLFSGDTVAASPIFMFGRERSLPAFRASLESLQARAGEYDEIYPAHGPMPQKPEILTRLLRCCEAYAAGELEPSEPPFPLPAKVYSLDGVGLLLH